MNSLSNSISDDRSDSAIQAQLNQFNQLNQLDQEDEEIQFAEEIEPSPTEKSWKILIVDDEIEVHHITKLALNDFIFEEKSLFFLSAYSAQEAKALMQAHPDIAIIFLDVVMETDDAGLQLVQYIREELSNPLVRIILRTGQPGRCPEQVVAANYEIDDYKTKTELTAQKLFVSVVTALRAFSTLMKILEASRSLELRTATQQQLIPASDVDRTPEPELNALQQTSLQSVRNQQIEVLGKLVSEITQEIINSANDTNALYTLSIVTWVARIILRITDEHFAKLGLSQSKLAILIYLSSEPELQSSPSSLAKHCGVSRAAMTGLLDGLEQEGYVERNSHPSDRRALTVNLTPKGQEFLDCIAPQDQYRISELMSALSEVERQKLVEMSMKAIKLLEKRMSTSFQQEG